MVRDLGRLIDRITDAAATARGLADAVHWQAKAATVFHDRATVWAGEVSGLACAAETAQQDAVRAWNRAAYAASVPSLFAWSSR